MGVSLNLVSKLKIEKNVENKKEDDKKSINKINISENGKEKEEEKENIIVNTELINIQESYGLHILQISNRRR